MPSAATATNPRVDTSLVILSGMLLVINSHLEAFYPRPWMAGDGLLGNSIFFFVSGFGVTCSLHSRAQDFGSYYLRRILRIFPALFITELAFGWFAPRQWTLSEPSSLLGLFLYPTRFTYVRCIVVFYALLYFIVRFVPRKACVAVWMALLAGYAFLCWKQTHHLVPGVSTLSAVPSVIYSTYFFMVTLAGSHFASSGTPRLTRSSLLLLAVAVLLYAGARALVSIRQRVDLFPLLQAACFACVVQIFRVLASSEVERLVRAAPRLAMVIGALATVSLETYLLHTYFVDWPVFTKLPFPAGVVAVFAATFALAFPLAALVRKLRLSRSS